MHWNCWFKKEVGIQEKIFWDKRYDDITAYNRFPTLAFYNDYLLSAKVVIFSQSCAVNTLIYLHQFFCSLDTYF